MSTLVVTIDGEAVSTVDLPEPPAPPAEEPESEIDEETGLPVPPGPSERVGMSAAPEGTPEQREEEIAALVQDDHLLVSPRDIHAMLQASTKTRGLELDARSSAYKALPLSTWQAIARWSGVDQLDWRIDGHTCTSFAIEFAADCHRYFLARGVGYVGDKLESHALNLLLVKVGEREAVLVFYEPQCDSFHPLDGAQRELLVSAARDSLQPTTIDETVPLAKQRAGTVIFF